MAEAEKVWAPARWQAYKKHRPPPGVLWKKLVADTGAPDGEAYYHPSITEAAQREMEIDCINEQENLFLQRGHLRRYHVEMDEIIGASGGEETRHLYVEYLAGGEVHGRPITQSELAGKGKQL